MIDLYAVGTANGQKAAVMLEETGCAYEIQPFDMMKGDHLATPYLAINPIGKIPAIIDRDGPGGREVTVFETLAIALYLCEKSGKLMPSDAVARALAWEWACVATANLAPALSYQFQFTRNLPDTSGPSIEYLLGQADRFFKAIDGRLAEAVYVAGEFSFADVQIYPIAATSDGRLPDGLAPYPNVRRWCDSVAARPAVERGMGAMPPLG